MGSAETLWDFHGDLTTLLMTLKDRNHTVRHEFGSKQRDHEADSLVTERELDLGWACLIQYKYIKGVPGWLRITGVIEALAPLLPRDWIGWPVE